MLYRTMLFRSTCRWRLKALLPVAAALAVLGPPNAEAATVTPAGSTSSSRSLSEVELPQATLVVVSKSKRQLELRRGNQLLRRYRISLGLNPIGHKQYEGDFRTPEGKYLLTRRNPRSEFFLSIAVSYPDSKDLARARRAGVRPGGLIMVHGLPNDPRWPPEHYAGQDWTDGCIALNNADMMEFWMLVQSGTPIHINP